MNILYFISILIFFGVNISNGMRDYIFVPMARPFSSADAYCKSNFGTRLATVKSSVDNNRANQVCPTTCYIGINDIAGEGNFKNLDGSPALYKNWAPREPNNVGNEDCVEMVPSGQWNDIGCGTPRAFLCDKPAGSVGGTPTPRPTPKPTFRPTFRPISPTFRPTDRPAVGGGIRDYIYVTQPMSFYSATSYCKSRYGTSLATIKSPMDNSKADFVCKSKCYIGINDRSSEGRFTNSDGTPATYFNWNWGEPNNVGNEDCVEIQAGGRWNDISCGSPKAFLCDKPASSNPPGPPSPSNYIYISSLKTWYEAQSYCKSVFRTNLATIKNPADNSLAASKCSGTYFPYNQCFIGLNDRFVEGQFKNADGSSASYFNWNWGEPNNAGNEDCVEMMRNGKMNDLPCSQRRAFLCDAPPPGAHQANDIETDDIFNDINAKTSNPAEKTGEFVYFIGLLSGVVLMMIMGIIYTACKRVTSNSKRHRYQYKNVSTKFTSDEDTSDIQSDA